jgi:hypothetical protein
MLTAEEREKLDWLCLLLKDEHDPRTFAGLVEQLNDLLTKADARSANEASYS